MAQPLRVSLALLKDITLQVLFDFDSAPSRPKILSAVLNHPWSSEHHLDRKDALEIAERIELQVGLCHDLSDATMDDDAGNIIFSALVSWKHGTSIFRLLLDSSHDRIKSLPASEDNAVSPISLRAIEHEIQLHCAANSVSSNSIPDPTSEDYTFFRDCVTRTGPGVCIASYSKGDDISLALVEPDTTAA